MIVIGLMSGTSADGIDAAVVEIEGQPAAGRSPQDAGGLRWRLLAHVPVPHPQALREQIFAAFRPETATVDRLCALNFALGRAFGQAALKAMEAAGLAPGTVDLIGSHGQTVWHIADGPDASTLQLGEPAVIAETTGVPVISNFRTRDMAAGGQGAPLVAYVDTLLLAHATRSRAAQNIGGIANVTFLPPAGGTGGDGLAAFAFDTGPGNMLIDYAAGRATGGAWTCDRDGEMARRGRVDESLLAELLAEPYLHQPPPKTTGRELFGVQFGAQAWDAGRRRGLEDVDIVATMTAFTARSIAQAYRDFLPRFPDEVVVSGGGARNPVLMAALRAVLAPATVLTSGEVGLPEEAKEAIAFAVLAYESWHGRQGNLPAATGARRPVVLGNLTPGQSPLQPIVIGARRPVTGQAGSRTDAQPLPLTEARNPATADIDSLSTIEMVQVMNAADAQVPAAVAEQLPAIAEAIDGIAARMRRGGRLIYAGAGTSGRLAVLDAAECPPTFSSPPGQVVALIAGGTGALTRALEGAEDDTAAGERDIAGLNAGPDDSVVGVAASGRTPYVLGAMAEARRRGAFVISLACDRPSPMADLADVAIAPVVGPEVITGSTRLKSGTAQKLVLNMLSTGVMVRLGKTYGNLMVDVQATNAKLRARARRIVQEACGISGEAAADLLKACNGDVKVAIVSALAEITADAARRRLDEAGGVVRAALRAGPERG